MDREDFRLALETTTCDLCGADETVELLLARDRRYGIDGEFPVVRCKRCRLVYVNPRPTPASLGHYYPPSYAPHTERGEYGSALGRAVRRLAFKRQGRFARSLMWLYNSMAFRALTRSDAPGRVLDVGCGRGSYLQIWQELGWQVEGIEPNPKAAEHAAAQLDCVIHRGFLEEVDIEPERFDLITMSHSLEHLRSPRAGLRKLRPWLKAGGHLLLMVPNFAAVDRLLFGAHWYGLEVPRHLYHFEPDTLATCLAAEGFEVLQMGATAEPNAVVRSAQAKFDRPIARDNLSGLARAVITGVIFPAAAMRRSTSLWTIARVAM